MKLPTLVPLVVLSSVMLLALAACGSGSSEDTDSQISEVGQLSSSVDQVHLQVEETARAAASLEGRLSQAEEKISQFAAQIAVPALDRTLDIPEPPSGKVALRFSFEYPQGPLAGDGIVVNEPSPQVNTVWAMESLGKGQEVPAGVPLEGSTIFLTPGETTTVTLVYKNPQTAEVGWLALPHQETPGSLHTKTWLTCFCLSFVWKAPAEGSWYRVIGVRISPDTPAGSKIDARWTILTDPSVFPTT